MSAKHAVLGLLLDKPGYGYELGSRLERKLGPGWRVNSGQLHQAIEGLRRDGFIERVPARQPHNKERHVYSITTAGIEEFEDWLDQLTDSPRLARRPLLVKVTLAGRERIARTLAQLERYRADRAQLLTELLHQQAELADGTGPLRADHALLRLSLSADIFQLEGELRWATHATQVVSSLLSEEVVWSAQRGAERAVPRVHEETTHAGPSVDHGERTREALFARIGERTAERSTQSGGARPRLLPAPDEVDTDATGRHQGVTRR